MALYRFPAPPVSEITPRSAFLTRRSVMGGVAGLGVAGSARGAALPAKPGAFSADETPTPKDYVTHFNNFYEFGLEKDDPSKNSGAFQPMPWTLRIEGMVNHPQTIDMAALLKSSAIEQRVYRMRCVEAWSMVIPWDGIPLSVLLKQADPLGSAKFVAFESVVRPSQMPGQRSSVGGLEWPYVEGLRLDEAMHPLTLLAMGIYGETLPNQNGAPIRLVVPWKYGFKGIKSITRIRLVEEMPETSWNQEAPNEYGFYANVNPEVDHPRWSQASERVIGSSSLFGEKRKPTQKFNGYGDQVASLYAGMDLSRDI